MEKWNISDIMSFKDVNFYMGLRKFMTISNFIATYQDHEQTVFNVLAHHDVDATPLDIEKSILENALWTVGDNEDNEMGSIYDLVKLSSCTYWMEKYLPEHQDTIKKFTERQSGKWYFQPDQRCVVVQQFVDEDPRIASEVMSHKDWMVSEGCEDYEQEKFDRCLIDCLNNKRIEGFKEKYGRLIDRTFGERLGVA